MLREAVGVFIAVLYIAELSVGLCSASRPLAPPPPRPQGTKAEQVWPQWC